MLFKSTFLQRPYPSPLLVQLRSRGDSSDFFEEPFIFVVSSNDSSPANAKIVGTYKKILNFKSYGSDRSAMSHHRLALPSIIWKHIRDKPNLQVSIFYQRSHTVILEKLRQRTCISSHLQRPVIGRR